MKIRHVIGVVGALVFLLLPLTALVFWVRGQGEWRELEADWEEARQKFEAFLDEDARRPVLRGEARPGDGGGKLATMLKELEKTLQVEQYSKFASLRRGRKIPPNDLEGAREARKVLLAMLPRLREAIQHESCRLPLDLTRRTYGQYPALIVKTLGFSDALMLEARELAAAGRRSEALANVADAIRLGHDLGRKTGTLVLKYAGSSVEENAIHACGGLLQSHPFTAEELSDFAGELAVLAATRPPTSDCFAVEEYSWLFIFPPVGIPGKVVVGARGGLGLDLYHARYRKFVEIYDLPIAELRKASLEFDAQARVGTVLAFGQPSPRALKESELCTRALFACLQAAVQVQALRARGDSGWPEDLPLDPWDGKPLRFKEAEGNRPAIVYSVGANLIDDGGTASGPYQQGLEGDGTDTIFPISGTQY